MSSVESKLTCSSCLCAHASLKKNYRCGVCDGLVCKDCVQFPEDDRFPFLKKVPEELKHDTYCRACYDRHFRPALESYQQLMWQAKNIFVFERKTREYIPLVRKSNHKITVENCADRKDAILRLAFHAAEQSFNAILDVDITSKKIRMNGYQTTSWSGSAYPAQIRQLSQS